MLTHFSKNTVKFQTAHSGFTLPELLIALAILALIAVFTIPKVLQAQQNNKFNAIAKETAGMLTGAYTAFMQSNRITTSTKPSDFSPYLNYVAVDTTLTIDNSATTGTIPCSSTNPCILLHNGAILRFDDAKPFGGTATTNCVTFRLDPDGVPSTDGSGRSVQLLLYTNGFLTTRDNYKPGSYTNGASYAACPNCDPTWLQWN